MSKNFLVAIFILFPFLLMAQQENWDVYMAQYENKPGSILLNLSLKSIAPIKTLQFVVISGVSFRNCDSIGMPDKRELTNLYRISDSVQAIVNSSVKNNLVGSFTYLCQRLDYFYVNDTTGLRQKLTTLYKTKFPLYIPYINIKEDKNWTTYLNFLYPNEATMEFMQNQKVISALQKGGDKLVKARPVDHWLYFKTEADRNCFITYATKQQFKIVAEEKTANLIKAPFKLHLSRTDKVDAASISRITLELKKQANQCNGEYDGWETFVVKQLFHHVIK